MFETTEKEKALLIVIELKTEKKRRLLILTKLPPQNQKHINSNS